MKTKLNFLTRTMKNLAIGVPLLLLALATTSPALANGANGDRVTVAIACSSGVVDQDWKITVEITDADGNPKGRVTHYVPYHTTADAAAEGIKDGINNKFNGTGATTAEGSDSNYPANQSQDIVLPAGSCIGRVWTEKKVGGRWKPSKGHLKVIRGGSQISVGGPPPDKRLLMARRAGLLTPEELSVLNLIKPIESLTLGLEPFGGEPLLVELALSGLDEGGNDVLHRFSGTFDDGTPVGKVLAAIRHFAEPLGFEIDDRTAGQITLLPSIHGPEYYGWSFSAGAVVAEECPVSADAGAEGFELLEEESFLQGLDTSLEGWSGIGFFARETLRD